MNTILISPNNVEELSTITDFLTAKKLDFWEIENPDNDIVQLSEEDISDIELGEKEIAQGEFFSSDDIRKMMEKCVK